MMFFSQLHTDAARPSYFEMVVQQQLLPGLKGALKYVLSVFAVRHERLMWALQHADEIFAVGQLLLEGRYLWQTDASYSENFYGLRRAKRSAPGEPLRMWHRLSSLFFLVGLPYVRSKLDAKYEELCLRAPPLFGSAGTHQPPTGRLPLTTAELVFVRVYPVMNAVLAAAAFLYHVLYLYADHAYFSPELHVQRLIVRRVTREEMVCGCDATSAGPANAPNRYRANSAESPFSRPIMGLVALRDLLSDYAFYVLPAAIFSFRFLEWWYSENSGHQQALPVPPPPAPLPPASDGIALPASASQCPLCRQERTNPCALPTGYVFCYPCIVPFLREHHVCPVTRVPMEEEAVVRIFDAVG